MAEKIKVLMLLDNEFPADNRVEKMILSMQETNISVDLLNCTKVGKPNFEVYKGFNIYRWNLSKILFKFGAASIITPFYFNRWKKEVDILFSKNKYDVIHINDLPLVSVGYYAKQKYGCKLVSDQHEFYSNWINRTSHYNKGLGKIIKALSNWPKYEKKYLNLSDLVVTVSTNLHDIYLKRLGLDANNIIIVPNTPDKSILTANAKNDDLEKYKDDFIIFYGGGIDILRGIDIAIKAMPKILESIPNAKMILAGPVYKGYNPFDTINRLNLEKKVIHVGVLPQLILADYISRADICYHIPPADNEEANNSIATKIYQYGAQSKPIIVSDAKMMHDFVIDNKLGLAIYNNNSEQFADNAIRIYNKDFEFNNEGKSYFWEDTVKPILEWYAKLS